VEPDEGDPMVDSMDTPVGYLNDDPFLASGATDENSSRSTGNNESTTDYRLLLTVGLDDLKRDAILRYCISQDKSLSTVLEEQIQQFAAEVLE